MPRQRNCIGRIFCADIHLQLEIHEFFAVLREATPDLVHSRSLARFDSEVFRLHALGGHFRLDRFRNLFDGQIQTVRNHGNGLRQANVLDHAGFYLRAEFFDGHSRADFFLQRQAPLRCVHHAQRFDVFDALRNSCERHDQFVHDEARVHTGAHQRYAGFLRRGIQLRREFRIRSKRIG